MPKKASMTNEQFAEFIEQADGFACTAERLAHSWPFGLSDPPPDLERACQTINLAAESLLALQRHALGRLALAADGRRRREQFASNA